MILQIVKTFVDDEDGEVITWDIDLTDEELTIIENIASCNNGVLPSSAEDEEPLVFRGKTYDDPCLDLEDLLDEIGKRIAPDCVISIYVH